MSEEGGNGYAGDSTRTAPFCFKLIAKDYDVLRNRDLRYLLKKWDLVEKLEITCFSFDRKFTEQEKENFFRDFFRSEDPVQAMIRSGQIDRRATLESISSIKTEKVPCSVLSLGFLDRALKSRVIRDNGSIVECLQEYQDDVLVGDELRKMLVVEDSDNAALFSESDRNEFLFRLFQHLVIGGMCCQYEDNVYPYYRVTKQLYKDTVCVRKDSKGNLSIKSEVFKVSCYVDDVPVYPSTALHQQDFAYFVIDPIMKLLHVVYHRYR